MNPFRLKISGFLTLFLLILISISSCGGEKDTPVPSADEELGGVAVNIDFIAEHPVLQQGECSLIEWHVEGGFSVILNGEEVKFSGQRSVCPEETTSYLIMVDAGDRMKQAEVTILVGIGEVGIPTDEDEPSETGGSVDEASIFKVMIKEDLVYGTYTTDGQSHNLYLDLYLPVINEDQIIPVIVYVHGGGWFEGNKDTCPGNTFASRGYAVACVEYRLANSNGCLDENTFPVQIHDIKAAVRWLRSNSEAYGLDDNKIAAMGDSSGGHLAALLGTSNGVNSLEGDQNLGPSAAVQAVVDWYGPVDIINGPQIFSDDPCVTSLEQLNQTYGGEETQYFYWTLAWGYFLGGSLEDPLVIDRAYDATPITHIDPSDPPFLILHGENDSMVPIEQSEFLVDYLEASGVVVTFIRIPDAGHGYEGPDAEVMDNFLLPTLDFLNEHLGQIKESTQSN